MPVLTVRKTGVAAAIAAVLGGLVPPAFAGTTAYKYDALGRVIEVDYPTGRRWSIATTPPVIAPGPPVRQGRNPGRRAAGTGRDTP